MNCIHCGKKIPKARLLALPDTETCVKCSTVEKYNDDSRGTGQGQETLASTTETEKSLRESDIPSRESPPRFTTILSARFGA
jgi:hypothetical protein